jgi:hypothetical protein
LHSKEPADQARFFEQKGNDMPRLRFARPLFLASSALVLLTAAAEAQVRYVAATGKDGSNNCQNAAAPCRSLQRGINATPAGGELRVLGSGFYGSGLINKTMTMSADGETVMLNGPLTIDATGAVVTLEGLSLNGRQSISQGIHVANAAAVYVRNCRVERFSGAGIESLGNDTELFVIDSVSRDNGGVGLRVTGASTQLTVDNSRFENNASGISGSGTVGNVTGAVISGNRNDGIDWSGGSLNVVSSIAGDNQRHAYAVFGGGRIDLQSSIARGNGLAALFVVTPSDAASISNFVATNNGYGISNSGTVRTRQNNTFYGNTWGNQGAPPTPLPPI